MHSRTPDPRGEQSGESDSKLIVTSQSDIESDLEIVTERQMTKIVDQRCEAEALLDEQDRGNRVSGQITPADQGAFSDDRPLRVT